MNKYFVATALMWCAIAASFPLYAQQQPEHTLGSLWPEVEKNYPGIGIKSSEIDAAAFHKKAVKANSLPQAKIQAQNTYGTFEGSAGAFFPQAGFFNVSGSTSSLEGSTTAANTFGSALVDWELFSFGKLRHEKEAAEALYGKAVSEKEGYVLQLKKELSQRYIQLLYSHVKFNLSQKTSNRLDEVRTITSGLSSAGLEPAADSLLASSSYIQALSEQDKWNGFLQASLTKVRELYGKDSVYYLTSASRFAKPVAITLQEDSSIDASNPVLQVLKQQSLVYTLNGKAEKNASLPSLHLMGGYAYRGTGINTTNGTVSGAWNDGFSNTTNNYLFGVGITWNITNLHTNKMKSASLLKQAESTELLRDKYELALQADLTALHEKITQQYSQLQKTGQSVTQSKEAYQMYLARYKSGIIGLSELLQIQTLLEQAENKHVDAARDFWELLADEAALTGDFEYVFNNL